MTQKLARKIPDEQSPDELRSLLHDLCSELDKVQQTGLSIETELILGRVREISEKALALLPSIVVTHTLESPKVEAINQKTVLVVDDDEDSLTILKYQLTRKAGFMVECRRNGADALAYLKTKVPDVILIDLMMPQMTGFEFLRLIKPDPALKKVKILVASSRSFDKDRLAALEAGAHDFVPKPYNLQEVVLRLRKLMDP